MTKRWLTEEQVEAKNAAERARRAGDVFGVRSEYLQDKGAAHNRPQSAELATAANFRAGKRSKHGNVKTVVDGFRFDSKHEASHWLALKSRLQAGEIRNLRRQVRFSLFAPGGEHLAVWRADFVFEENVHVTPVWRRVVGDAKSAHTVKLPGWAKIKTLMLACHNVTVREFL